MAEDGIFSEYFGLDLLYTDKLGKNTIVVYQLGKFYEIWEYDPSAEADQVVTGDITGNVALRLSMRDSTNSEPRGLAREAARVLGMNLTSKKSGEPHSFNNPYMVGFPTVVYSLHKDTLLLAGFNLVRVDQTEKLSKGFKREVIEILSPATEICSPIPDSPVCNNCIVGIYLEFISGTRSLQRSVIVAGLAQINLMTGSNTVCEVYSREGDESYILQEINRFLISKRPSQILLYMSKFPENRLAEFQKYLTQQLDLDRFSNFNFFTSFDHRCQELAYQEQFLQSIFPFPAQKVVRAPGSEVLERLKLDKYQYGRIIYLLVLKFCHSYNESLLLRLQAPRTGWTDSERLLVLHNNASDQLDLFPKELSLTGILHRRSQMDCLLSVLDGCATPMGSRFLRNRMLSPLTNPEVLEMYYAATEALMKSPELLQKLHGLLQKLPDLETLQRKAQLELLQPRELVGLIAGYRILIKIDQEVCEIAEFGDLLVTEKVWDCFQATLEYLQKYLKLDVLKSAKLVRATMNNSTKVQSPESFFIEGFCNFVDPLVEELESHWFQLRQICEELSPALVPKLERRTKKEQEELPGPEVQVRILTTEAKGKPLKKHPGIRVTKFNSKAVQISSDEIEELSFEIESLHQSLEEYLVDLYLKLLQNLQQQNFFSQVRLFACNMDFVVNNARMATRYKFYRPQVEFCEQGSYLEAEELRHPLVERISSGNYLPNSVSLGKGSCGILAYGSNASGKSTLSKAAAIAVIMAQMGCFVPGKIKLGLFKRIITRLSGNDNIHKGLSSYVVEMMELKIILMNADAHSLVLGDELSRGTESGSGTGLTVAAIEELCKRRSCFLFATHMHQLVEIPVIQTLKQQGLLWIGHLSSVYDAELQTMVYDRVLREGSGTSNYGLEILKSLGFPKEFIQRSIEHRQQYLGTSELLGKKSRYNSRVYVESCSVCGSKQNLHTHHLKEQQTADRSGMIGSMPMNSSGNLLVLCESCHQKHHRGELDLKKLQTSMGDLVVI